VAANNKRPVVFVCSGFVKCKVVCKTISADNFSAARDVYYKEYGFKPSITLGPLYKKRGFAQEIRNELKFLGISKRAEFDGWEVSAELLLEPDNCAYLFFKKRLDGKNIPIPEEHMIVDVESLRFI